jgi:hypothetical protein
MKKLLTLVCVLVPCVLFAQISKNQWLVGGSVLAQYTETTANSNKEIDVKAPAQVGYFVIDKLSLGVRGLYHFNQTKTAYLFGTYFGNTWATVNQTQKEFAVGPFIRYYFLPQRNRFNLFLDASYGYGKSTTKMDLSQNPIESVSKTNTFNINIEPVFFINKHVSTEFVMAYYLQKQEGRSDSYTNFLLGLGFQIHLGNAKEKSK